MEMFDIIILWFFQGKLSHKAENYELGEEEEEEEEKEEEDVDDIADKETVQVKTPVFSLPNGSLGDIPVICKTEEVHTEELLVEEVSEIVNCYCKHQQSFIRWVASLMFAIVGLNLITAERW